MRILKYEIKKLLKSPLLWGLLAAFVAFNIFTIYNNFGYKGIREAVTEVHSAILEAGINLYSSSDKLNQMLHSEEEYTAFYASYVEAYKSSYDNLDMQEIKQMKEDTGNFHPTGSYKQFIDENYDKLQKRVEEIKSCGDDAVGFYPGDSFNIHKKLYNLLMIIIIEMLIMICFSVLYLMDYERINRTEDLVFSAEIGRKDMLIKWFAGMTAGLLYCTILLTAGLYVFFALVPMKGLWSVPISSYMVMESSGLWEYPFITFVRLTTLQHLVISVFTAFFMAFIFGAISGGIQLFVHSSYITMISIAAGFIGLLALPFATSSANWIKTALCLNPASMWRACTRWFIEYDICVSFAWSEFVIIGLWAIIATILFSLGILYFKRVNI